MNGGTDPALKITVPRCWAEVVGAVLMERFGPFAEETSQPRQVTLPVAGAVLPDAEAALPDAEAALLDTEAVLPDAEVITLVFYPGEGDPSSDSDILALLPEGAVETSAFKIEWQDVPRDWVDGWKDHFHPLTIGRVRVRPPWEAPAEEGDGVADVVINPGLGFGTGLHPTTRGTLTLLQQVPPQSEAGDARPGAPASAGSCCTLVDVGTGSGVLSIAAAKLGWGPIIAFDNDAVALESARENFARNGVEHLVEVYECGLEEAPLSWFEGSTVLANMTLIPVITLLGRVSGTSLSRSVVSGILAGEQERLLLLKAESLGFVPRGRLYEEEWVSMEFVPAGVAGGG